MVEGSIQVKPDEQYPLLMVSGAGDAGVPPPPPTVGSSVWNTTVRPKRPWSARWPEYLSTCWMTIILLGISFLVFYAIGMVVIYRTEAYFIVRCNQTKRTNDVFYHELIPRSGPFPFNNYADYLANVATIYPHLKFNVYFLLDDSKTSGYNFYDQIHYSPDIFNYFRRREVRLFQKKHPNVNVTVMLLSKYMAMTPLKYRWRSIPTPYLPFYARVFAVWLYGGVGLDLSSHNDKYHVANSRDSDWKAKALLKLHNDGISAEKYKDTLNRIKRKEESEFFSSFIYDMVQKMFNETYWMFNKTLGSYSQTESGSANINDQSIAPQPTSSSLVRTHRNKRQVDADLEIVKANSTRTVPDNVTTSSPVVNIVLANTSIINITGNLGKNNVHHISDNEPNMTEEPLPVIDENKLHFNKISDKKSDKELTKSAESLHLKSEAGKNKSDLTQIILFDFSVISEPVHSNVDSQRLLISSYKNRTAIPVYSYVTLDTEGSFIASSTHMHPFLGSILTEGGIRLHPKLAIQNALLTHCSGPFRYEDYCNTVYVL